MKVIDLLNKIANGEEVPKKIKYKDKIYSAEFNCSSGKSYYCDDEGYTLLLEVIDSVVQLNEEVEIIEEDKHKTLNDIRESYGLPRIEDKKIKKIELTNGGLTLHKIIDDIDEDILINSVERTLVYTINEIIDYLEENK